ncbi:MAG TPA: FtsX-like permease family protein, partial [Hanamia sp.]|nr:FtsX-like permease family protein [Hanamia sp.]
ATTGTKPGPQFARTFPEIEDYARTFISHNVVKSKDKLFDEPRILYADPAFFKIFSFNIVEGNAANALDAPDKIAISESMAKKYFGNEDAIGKTLTSGGKDLRVSAVFKDVPQNSQIKFDFATQFENLGPQVKDEQWWTANWITYFLLHNHKDIAPLQKQISNYMQTADVRKEADLTGNDYLFYHLEPLTKVHLFSLLPGFEPNGNINTLYMLGVIALLILIIACANYTNLATAQSAGRSNEIGMRKVMGASKKQIFIQFISESSVITFVAASFAFILALFLIPYFNQVTGQQFSYSDVIKPLPILALLSFTILVSFFAGLYPALVLSGTQVMGVLKKGFNFTGGNNFLRKALIVAQFGISVFLIIYTVVILQQMHFMQNKDLGYDKDHIVVLPISGNMIENLKDLKAAFQQVPDVQAVTTSYDAPENVGWGDGISTTDEKGKHDISVNAMPVDLDFTNTLKMKIIAGRDFIQSDFGMMDTSNNYQNYQQPFIINETLARKIGWTPEEAIGKTLTKGASGPVVGVVKDFNYQSLHEPIGPMVIFLGPGYSRNFLLRISGKNIKSTLAKIGATWNERITDRPFTYHFLDDAYNKLYEAQQRTSALFSIAAGLAIILACLGLFGLTAFATVQRSKEIGIRRVLGANVSSITLLISKNFLELIGIAILIAAPFAWWASNNWLQDFAFRINVHPFVFLAAAVFTALISLFTIGYHTVKISLSNPVKSLRSE